MRTIKVDLKCQVPSWNYCNHDGPTKDNRFSKEVCRFCVSTKAGKRCMLYDQALTADEHFIHKTCKCIDATAGFKTTIEDEPQISIDPKEIIRETLKEYNKTVKDLQKQGYPQVLAETLATKYLTGEK